jgi:diadenylate cyclase
MFDAVIGTLQDLVPTLRLADLLDVALVAAFVYAVITWFRQARSRIVMSGLATLVVVYFLARLLEMTLTLLVYQVGITVAAVALVVVFQEEIRRAFERVAFTRPLDHLRQTESRQSATEVLVAAAFDLAKARTGALIVLKGKESLERHLTGGVPLGGIVSEPLLMSIFDASSAGHDGALVVEEELASRFAVHLPLSQEITGKERFGTRHAAALGLSERSDALIIVVSEERGEVSVAQGGNLASGLSRAQVTERVKRFRRETTRERPGGMVRALLTRDPGTKLVSVVIALAGWLVVHGYDSQTIARTFDVPVVLRDVPEDLFIDPPRPDVVRITLSGPQGEFRRVDPNALAVMVDATDLKPGISRRAITRQAVNPPPGVVVQRVEPLETTIVVHATRIVELPVRVRTTGTPAAGYRVTRTTATPASIPVRLAVKDVGSVRFAESSPVALDGRNKTFLVTQPVELPEGARAVDRESPTTVIRVEIGAR